MVRANVTENAVSVYGFFTIVIFQDRNLKTASRTPSHKTKTRKFFPLDSNTNKGWKHNAWKKL